MAYETKPDTGSLFRNDRREKDSQPHAKGSALIDGVDYWVSAWTNTAKDGSKYQALKFERKEQRQPDRTQAAANERWGAPVPSDPLDDEIPF